MNLPEADLEYCVRAFTRITSLCDRLDLGAPERLRQIREQAAEAVGRERLDEEVVAQLKATVVEFRNKCLSLGDAKTELAELQIKLASSERARAALEERLRTEKLGPDRERLYARLEDLGAVLVDAYGSDEAIACGTRAAVALAKRAARELGDEERLRRGKAALLELLEGSS